MGHVIAKPNRFIKPRFEWRPRHNPDHPLSQGIVGHWLLNEGAGAILYDIGNDCKNGTVTATWTGGRFGSALNFNGTTNYAVVPNVPLHTTDQVSVSFWLAFTSTSPAICLEYSTSYNIYNAFMISLNDPTSGKVNCSDHTTTPTSRYNVRYTNNAYNDGMWHHVVGVIDRKQGATSESIIYVDGFEAPSTLSETYNRDIDGNFDGPYSLYLMSRAGSAYYQAGKLSDVRVYSRVLSAMEVNQLYKDPFCDLEVNIYRRYFFMPTVSFNPAWAKQSNVTIVNGITM